MSIDRNKYLGEVLHTHKLRHIEKFVKKVKDRRDEIKEVMSEHYGEKNIRLSILEVWQNIQPQTLSLTWML